MCCNYNKRAYLCLIKSLTQQKHTMTQQVCDHICRATKTSFTVHMWWGDAEVVASIGIAVQNGWVLRTSITQVEWTEKGVEAAKEMKHLAEVNAIQSPVKALEKIQEMSGLLIALKDEIKLCTWADVENCFPKDIRIRPLDEDFRDWLLSIRSQSRQIYLLEKAGDKTENEAARAAIQFIHKKATAK